MLNRAEFREKLVHVFSVDELDNLAYDVGMNTSSFSSHSIDVRARELLQFCERLGDQKLRLLSECCARSRPEVDWLSFITTNKIDMGSTAAHSQPPAVPFDKSPYPPLPQLPYFTPTLQLVGRWQAETTHGYFAIFDFFPNGLFEITSEGMHVKGRWLYDPATAMLSMAGLLNGVTPYVFGVMVTSFSSALFFALDGYGIIYRYTKIA